MKQTIAIVGTGIMGSGIADNFIGADHAVIVWNRTMEHAEELLQKGAKPAASPREATKDADIIFEVTASDESSKSVWHGDDGILAGADADKVLITSATLTVNWTEQLAKLCAEHSFTFFDMPLTGGRAAAENGSLTLLVGGDEPQLEQLKPVLSAISAKIFYFGSAGSGMKYKLILNSLQAAHLVAFGEAMKLAKATGLDPAVVGPALVDRPGGVLTEIGWKAYQETSPPLTFSVDWITKDLGYAQELAGELDLALFKDTLEAFKRTQSEGHGSDDWTVINK
jgi:3-hydroxyisobutyrate dehydrogenase